MRNCSNISNISILCCLYEDRNSTFLHVRVSGRDLEFSKILRVAAATYLKANRTENG